MTRTTPTAIHPGEFLHEILAEAGISQLEFARSIGVSPMRVSHIVRGTRPISADLALRFAQALRQSPQYWLNLQTDYDLKMAQHALAADIRTIPALVAA